RIAFLNSAFHRVRDAVTFAHRNIAIDFDMKIDIEAQTHFADKTLVDSHNTRNRSGRFADAIDNCATRRGIENFVKRRPKKANANATDDKTDEDRGPVVGATPFLAANQRNRNSSEGRN